MSKAEEQGWEMALDNDGRAFKAEWWHSEAHAQGYLRGIDSLIENILDTPDKDFYHEHWDAKFDSTKEQRIERYEKAKEKTQAVIDQIVGGEDHQNTIQRMAKVIEGLREEVDHLNKTIWESD